jgi:hypothetical protein
MNSVKLLQLFNQKHYPEIAKEEHEPILPEELVVEKKDIPIRIECELMAGICMSLMGDNIVTIIQTLNKHFKKNIQILPLVRSEKEHNQIRKQIKTNKKYKDGAFYPKGYSDDNVHWYYENDEFAFDGYTQMKQMDGGHQFCQGHAIALAYYPTYRYTYQDVKNKEWFVKGDLLGAYKEAYVQIIDTFRTLLPIMFQTLSKKQLIQLINQLIKEQYIDKDDGGEDPRYYRIVHDRILSFLKLFIKKPSLVISKKNDCIPIIKQKGTGCKIKGELAEELTKHILKRLTQKWAIKYMSVGYYVDYDKIDYDPFANMEICEEESESDEDSDEDRDEESDEESEDNSDNESEDNSDNESDVDE